jgi:2-(1,2-epoxy-1,2-dihydrophenyl)acetyl-CoA isomerase
MSELIKHSVNGRVATLVLNRPQARNALSPELIEALIDAFRAAEADPAIKCIILTGEGEHFSGGGDVKSFNDTLAQSGAQRYSLYERKLLYGARLPNLIIQSRKPVIIQTRGAVAGAGLALCLAADFVISGQSSFFLAAHVHIGLSLDSGLSSLLVGAMGVKAAKRLALLGERIGTDEALALGIVTQVVADEALNEATQALAQRLAAGPAEALAGSKALINRVTYPGFDEQLVAEARQVARCAASDDFIHGIRAILDKAKPTFD